MPGKEQSRELLITVAGGTGTGTLSNEWAKSDWVRVVPTTESDTYDVTFKDAKGRIMVSRTGLTGTMAEQLQLSLGIVSTVVITNSSSSGTYTCLFDMH